jgi:hypothetical protein
MDEQTTTMGKEERQESPQYLRMSLAAAMTLDFVPGSFTGMPDCTASTCF